MHFGNWIRKFCLIGMTGIACDASATLMAAGFGSETLNLGSLHTKIWVGPLTGYWMPDGESGGLSVGGVFAPHVGPVVGIESSSNKRQGQLGLCTGTSMDLHRVNGSSAGHESLRIKHQALLKMHCIETGNNPQEK